MSFVAIFSMHSSHTYFAFILHLFMFSLVISVLTKALGWVVTCTNTLSWPVGSLTRVIYSVKQKVCGKTGTHMLFPSSDRMPLLAWKMQLQLHLWKPVANFGPIPNLYISVLEVGERSPNLFATVESITWAACMLTDPNSGILAEKPNVDCCCYFRGR